MQHCPSCGAKLLSEESQFCQQCGAKIPVKESVDYDKQNKAESKKSGMFALILCILFGPLGIHRFYVGKKVTGILSLITGGLLGVWTIIDLVRLSQNKFRDKKGNNLIIAKNLSPMHKIVLMFVSLIIWLIITISLLFTGMSYLTSGLLNTANAQLEALRKGNYQQAYSYTSAQYQQAISFDNFQRWLNEYPELLTNKSANFTQRGITHSQVDNDSAYLNSGFLEGTITTNDGKQISIKYVFLKENDQWKIVGIFPTH